jgi:hypothetical protein
MLCVLRLIHTKKSVRHAFETFIIIIIIIIKNIILDESRLLDYYRSMSTQTRLLIQWNK